VEQVNKVKRKMDRVLQLVKEMEELESELREDIKKLGDLDREEVAEYGYNMEDNGEVEGDTLGMVWEVSGVYPYRGYPFSEVER